MLIGLSFDDEDIQVYRASPRVDLSKLFQSYNFNQHFLFNKSSIFFEPIHMKICRVIQ